MNKIASFVKTLRLKQLAIVFLAGVVLLLNTACAGSAEAKLPSNDRTAGAQGRVVSNDPHPVNQTQPYKGGMNNFDDTPPEQIPANKAKSLVNDAQRNINRGPADIGRAASNIKDNVKDAADDVNYKSKQAAETLKSGARNAVEAAKDAID